MAFRLLQDLAKYVHALNPLSCWMLECIFLRVTSNCIEQSTPVKLFKLVIRSLANGQENIKELSEQQNKAIKRGLKALNKFIILDEFEKVLDTKYPMGPPMW